MVSEWIWRSLHFQMLNVKSDSLITNNFFRFFAGQIHTHTIWLIRKSTQLIMTIFLNFHRMDDTFDSIIHS